jgi:hypothetical protein
MSSTILQASLRNCEDFVCLEVATAHPSGEEDIMLKLEIKTGENLVWFAHYLPAYGLYMQHEFETSKKISTTWRLAIPKLPEGDYEAFLILQPIKGLQVVSQIRNSAFVPDENLTTIDEATLGNIACKNGLCAVSGN